jgi:hypothetical protein
VIWNLRSPIPLARLVEEFSDRLLAVDLPRLPAERRSETVAFAGRRIVTLPSPMRSGLTIVAVAVAGAQRVVGRRRVVRLLAARPLPVVGDYVRLVRSLTYAYVWETWPATAADGAAR